MKYTTKNRLRPGSIALGLGLMLTTLCQAQSWSGEQSLGGNFFGTPAVAQIPGSNVLQVFYEGVDNALWTRWRNSDGSWSGEQSLGGQLFPGICGTLSIGFAPAANCLGFNITPVAIQLPNTNDLMVFYRGSDNTLRYNFRDINGNWLGEANLGGQIWGNPAVVQVPGTDQIEVFYRGGDGLLKTQWGNQYSWVYETDMGVRLFGPTCSDITNDSCYGAYATLAPIQLPGTNYLEVFYRGPDNGLHYVVRDDTGTWRGNEANLGGHLSSDPSAAPIPGTNEIEVFYRGAGAVDGQLMYQGGNLDFWTYETPVTGYTEPLFGYHCDSYNPPNICGASYSAPKAYAVANDLWVFYRGTIAPLGLPDDILAWSTAQQTMYRLSSDQILTDPIGALIPGTNTIQIFYADVTTVYFEMPSSGSGYLLSRWFPN